jgi:hypothetical protein
MVGRRLAAAVAAFVVLVLCSQSSAKADFIYGLSVGNTWFGTGSIAFDTLSGNSPFGVTAFSFHVSTGIGSPQDYDLADILAINWSIDDSFNLSLLLTTSLIPFGAGHSGLLLSNQPGANPDPCGISGALTMGSITCETLPSGDDGAHFQGVLSARLIEVPEPATMALFGAGLVGIGLIACRRNAAQ